MRYTYEELKFKLATTESRLAATESKLAATEAELAKTQELLKKVLERVSVLEEKLNLNSKNSSKPPSSDQKPNSYRKKEERKFRHKGYHRSKIPPERVDRIIMPSLELCPHCGLKQLIEKGSPKVSQQVDLPKVQAVVTEFRCKKYKCTSCGKLSIASLPVGTPNSAFGPRLMALTATLTGAYHLSRRDVKQLMQDLYGIDLSAGSMINMEERVSSALQDPYGRIHQAIMQGIAAKHFDETSWRNSGRNAYVWIGSNAQATYMKIDPNRSRAAFERFTGKLSKGPIVTDRYSAYSHIKNDHQYCLAHLIRDFRKYAERDGPDGEIGKVIELELRKICKNQREFREETITKRSRNARFRNQKKWLEYHMVDGLANGSDKLSALCERLLDNEKNLWNFSNYLDVDPTNNLAERDLRKIVLWRKKSYGTRSDRGQRFVERVSSVTSTVRKAKKNIMEYMHQAVTAFYLGNSAPKIASEYGF